ncbi:MAG: metallophosphoesterase [Methanolinea sp.]|nr:metallophosphoesterase [Methanolinea sp.]
MKIVHIADTHLGLAQFQKVDPDTGMNLREKLIYDNFLASIDRIVALHPDVVVHAGDLFDQVRPKTMAYTTALEALGRLSGAGIPLVLIAGNHSMPKTRYTPSPFRVLEFHPADLHAAYRYRYEPVEIGECVFHLIPNMLRPEHYRQAYDQITPARGRYNVLVTHGLASSLVEKRLNTVAEHEIDTTMVSGGDWLDYVALGHYHGQVPVGERAWYSGSLEFLTYGEVDDTKGGLSIDLARRSVSHVPLPRTPMVDLGTIDAREVTPGEVPGLIRQRIDERSVSPLAMARVTLLFAGREHQRQVSTKDLDRERSHLLDLKVQVRVPGEHQAAGEPRDIRSIDFLAEFDKFLSGKNLDAAEMDRVRRAGREALSLALQGEEGEGGEGGAC